MGTGPAGPGSIPSREREYAELYPRDVSMPQSIIALIESGQNASMQAMSEAIDQIMQGKWSEEDIGRLLIGLHEKGETVEEIAGAAMAMRRHMTPIRTSRPDVMDVVGTGGDASGTFNISTAAAIVTAAAGVTVAKHGNRRFTSRTGSADVLVELGVNIEADVACVEECLEELGLCFCFAPLMHQAMRHVGPVRKRLPHPTIFNILGPLVNPAEAPLVLLGVGRDSLRPVMAEALSLLKIRHAVVVHGTDPLDEVSLSATTRVTEVGQDGSREFEWTPSDFGFKPVDRTSLLVAGPLESAAVIREVLANAPGPPRDIVVANAAAALWTAGKATSPREAAEIVAETLRNGAAAGLLARLHEKTSAPRKSA